MMRKLLVLCACGLLIGTTANAQTVLDFETEDDFSTLLINGQIIDTAFDPADPEFGNIVDISTTGFTHLGATIFDSTPGGPNAGGSDQDLLVGLGNIVVLQNTTLPATTLDPTYGLLYDEPNDEASINPGSLEVSFLGGPVELLSLDLIDANGGFGADVTLTDSLGNTRLYVIPSMWSDDIAACGGGCNGFETLDMTSLIGQTGEGGGTTSVVNGAGFDPGDVTSLSVLLTGNPGSGGIDNITFIPEPTTGILVGLGLLGLGIARRRSA
jgi:hypothetical protein